jgi:hypothetical protein
MASAAGSSSSSSSSSKWYSDTLVFLGGFVSGARYVIADSKRNKKNTLVGISTIFLVLSFVCLLQNGILHSPVIFLKLGENQVGEYDLVCQRSHHTVFATTHRSHLCMHRVID